MKKQRIALETFKAKLLLEHNKIIIHRGLIIQFAERNNYAVPGKIWLCKTDRRGYFDLTPSNIDPKPSVKPMEKASTPVVKEEPKSTIDSSGSILAMRNTEQEFFEEVDPRFVRWGKFSDLRAIIKSKKFFPTFVTGMSGNGKTTGIEQACAAEKREVIRVNFTRETNSDDLLGGLRLISGDTVFQYGPVAEAYLRGAVLILDECLSEFEKVRVGTVDSWEAMKLKDMEFGKEYQIVSFDMETMEYENDIGTLISNKEDELYKVTLDDGSDVVVNKKHPFVVKTPSGKCVQKSIADGLNENDEVVVA